MEENNKQPSCQGKVMSRIKGERICPRSRWFFYSRECLVWFLWLLSVLFGSLAVAAALFVINYKQYALYEATHNNFFTFFVESAPYFWIVVFGLMVLVAVFNLRYTKNGYKHPLWKILLSSVILSLAGGALLQLSGLGYVVDHSLGKQMRIYSSLEDQEERLWQVPKEGRLLGILSSEISSTSIMFTDIDSTVWQVDISELTQAELELLASQVKTRLIGQTTDASLGIFYACGAFPWIIDKKVSKDEMKAHREAFIDRMYLYKAGAEDLSVRPEGDDSLESSPCVAISAVKRIDNN